MKLFFGQIFPEVQLDELEAHHISKVLRMKDGEHITITDGKGNSANGQIAIRGKHIDFETENIIENHPPFVPKLHIAIAPTKNIDRIDFFVEKATELGISEITFLQTQNSERSHLKIEKIEKQVIAASKQSLRFHFPKIGGLVKLNDFLNLVNPQTTFVAHCDQSLERINLNEIPPQEEYTFLVGPEGDFSVPEIEMLAKKGIKGVSLGPQRLRTETAGVFLSAWNYNKMF